MLGLLFTLVGHVPTYSSSNCVSPPHVHDISQVVYLKGSGGLEIELRTSQDPFKVDEAELVDVDVTFRDEVNTSHYDLFIGCGGCHDDDALNANALINNIEYETPKIEPFTQTKFVSIFEKESKKFNTSALTEAECPEKKFTIRLVQHEGDDIVWGAIVGLKEQFTPIELLSFPIFILKNHGASWTNLWWTIFISAGAAALIVGVTAYMMREGLEGLNVRKFLYLVSIFGFTTAMIEGLIHTVIAQVGIQIGPMLYVAIFVCSIGVNVFGIGMVLSFWSCFVIYIEDASTDKTHNTLTWVSSVCCFIVGAVMLVILGAGYFVGPVALALAGIAQLVEFSNKKPDTDQIRPGMTISEKAPLVGKVVFNLPRYV